MNELKINPSATLRESMKQMAKVGERCLLVVDEFNYLVGTITDGDLRKAILSGAGFKTHSISVCQKNPTVLVKGKFDIESAKKIFINERFDLIPIVDNDRKLVDVLFFRSVIKEVFKENYEKINVPTVIMAGGKGTRLEPFTKILPKPLIPVHEKPIIEHIIKKFTDYGCNDFYLTVNYKSKILKAYFEEINPEYTIKFIEEEKPLGTAGSLKYLSGMFESPFFVTNCDIIVKSNYHSLYKFHKEGNYDLTLVASAKEYIIPYGTCELNEAGHLSNINEKPQFDFLINTGLYLINPNLLELIKENQEYHITHLMQDAKKYDKKIGVYPIDDDEWIDIGQWAEYKKAIDKI